jgi:predicted O-methyltransferase YrrM
MLNEIKSISESVNRNTICDKLCDDLFMQDQGCVYYKLIFKWQERVKPTASAELGVCTGRGTAHIAGGHPNGKVYGIDPTPYEIGYIISAYPNITLLRGRSDDKNILNQIQNGSLDLCFIDSDHSGNYTAREVELWRPKMKHNGIFLFDDIYLNESMRNFWNQLRLPKIALSGQHLTGPKLDVDVGFGCAIA